jgi:Rieske Fe-S protein
MAENEKSESRCIDRRSLLRGTAGYVVVALADGCSTSQGDEADGRPDSSASGGAGPDPGASGQSGTAGAGGDGAGGTAGSGGATRDAGSAGAGGVGGSPGTTGPDAGISNCASATLGGKATAVSKGTLVAVGGELILGRDAGGLYAMSASCTHNGCTVIVVGSAPQQSLHCPCHGSNFSSTGAVTRGPAPAALPHYQLEVSSDGEITVCTQSFVASTTRTVG